MNLKSSAYACFCGESDSSLSKFGNFELIVPPRERKKCNEILFIVPIKILSFFPTGNIWDCFVCVYCKCPSQMKLLPSRPSHLL